MKGKQGSNHHSKIAVIISILNHSQALHDRLNFHQQFHIALSRMKYQAKYNLCATWALKNCMFFQRPNRFQERHPGACREYENKCTMLAHH